MRFISFWGGTILVTLISLAALAQQIPPGTVLPIMLDSTLDARHDKPGKVISGRIMQPVPLPDGATIPRGAKVVGHMVSAHAASTGSPARITLRFDRLHFDHQSLPFSANLRALASMFEVSQARIPTNNLPDYGTSISDWNTIQIGGAGVFRGNGEVISDGQVVGRSTSYGAVTAKLLPAAKRGCPAGSQREQALWKFSPSACGTYGLAGLRILNSQPVNAKGEIVLQSDANVYVRGGSGWLLQTNSADADALSQ